jgi:hypothetical protein
MPVDLSGKTRSHQPARNKNHGDGAIDLHNRYLELSRTPAEHHSAHESSAENDGAPA